MFPNLNTGKVVFLCRVMYWCYVVLVSYVVYTNKPVLSKSKYLSIKYLSSMEDTHWEWGANPSVMKIFPDDCAVINHMSTCDVGGVGYVVTLYTLLDPERKQDWGKELQVKWW